MDDPSITNSSRYRKINLPRKLSYDTENKNIETAEQSPLPKGDMKISEVINENMQMSSPKKEENNEIFNNPTKDLSKRALRYLKESVYHPSKPQFQESQSYSDQNLLLTTCLTSNIQLNNRKFKDKRCSKIPCKKWRPVKIALDHSITNNNFFDSPKENSSLIFQNYVREDDIRLRDIDFSSDSIGHKNNCSSLFNPNNSKSSTSRSKSPSALPPSPIGMTDACVKSEASSQETIIRTEDNELTSIEGLSYSHSTEQQQDIQSSSKNSITCMPI